MLAELDLKALFESQEALALFLAFFIPGFIAKKIYGLLVPVGDQDFTQQLPEVIGYSAIHYGVIGGIALIPQVHSWWTTANLSAQLASWIIVFGIPLFEAPLILFVRDPGTYWQFVFLFPILTMMLSPTPTPWDSAFRNDFVKRVRIRLKNDKWIGGLMGRDSRASVYPKPDQLFISKAYELDESGRVVSKGQSGVGLLVNGTEISYIEITTIPRRKEPAGTGSSQGP